MEIAGSRPSFHGRLPFFVDGPQRPGGGEQERGLRLPSRADAVEPVPACRLPYLVFAFHVDQEHVPSDHGAVDAADAPCALPCVDGAGLDGAAGPLACVQGRSAGGDASWTGADGRAYPFVHRVERLRRSFLVAGVDPFVHGVSPHVGLFSGCGPARRMCGPALVVCVRRQIAGCWGAAGANPSVKAGCGWVCGPVAFHGSLAGVVGCWGCGWAMGWFGCGVRPANPLSRGALS